VFLVALSACASSRSSSAPRISTLTWLSGTWSGTLEDGTNVSENWTPPEHGAMSGTHEERIDGRLQVLGRMRIVGGLNGIVLNGSLDGKPKRNYALIDHGDARARFVDQRGEFPQSLEFACSGDRLTVTASGVDGTGGSRQRVIELRRTGD